MISSQQLGERISDGRKRTRLTQAQLAERLGLARTTVVAIEKGERRPTNAELLRLADVLGVTIHDLLREGLVRADVSPRFRGAPSDPMAAPVREAVDRLRVLAARYIELERMHGLERVRAPLETLATYRVSSGTSERDPRLEGEDAARTVRGLLGLGDEPARGLDERFESEAGLRIFYLDRLPPMLAAFLIWSDELGAAVAINRAHPAERQRWSLAHELGHFLRDREAGDVLADGDSFREPTEVFPEAFTKELLLPTSGVRKRFTERCRAGSFTPVDLYALARVFGVSFQAMALRLEELRLLPRGSYEKIRQSRVKLADLGSTSPPSAPAPHRHGLPARYIALAASAYHGDMLSEGELADVLATDIVTARDVLQEHERISLEDGSQVRVDLTGTDLRSA